MAPQIQQYFEDFAVGQTFHSSGHVRVGADEMKRFAAEYDPQPFHLDHEAALDTVFQGLAASGWHTAALTMKLFVQSDLQPVGGLVGLGFEGRWPKAVRPGDELHIEIAVTGARPSKSNPTRGLITLRVDTLNQHGDAVQVSTFTIMVPRRPAGAS